MDRVNLTYRDNITGKIVRTEVYWPPKPYTWRDYALDVLAAGGIAVALLALCAGMGCLVLLAGW